MSREIGAHDENEFVALKLEGSARRAKANRRGSVTRPNLCDSTAPKPKS
jgi:hypothetical protein